MKFRRPQSIDFMAQACIWGGLLVFVSGTYVALARFLRIPELAENAETLYEKNAEAFLAGYTPFYAEYMPIFPSVVALLGLVLFVAGMGMLKMRTWSRKLAVLVCLLTIVLFLGELTYQYAVVLPGLDAWFSEHRAGVQPEAEAPRVAYLIDAGLAASFLPLAMIGLALLLWHAMRSPLFANTLVFGAARPKMAAPAAAPRMGIPVAEKPKRAHAEEELPPIPPKKKRHRSRKDQES